MGVAKNDRADCKPATFAQMTRRSSRGRRTDGLWATVGSRREWGMLRPAFSETDFTAEMIRTARCSWGETPSFPSVTEQFVNRHGRHVMPILRPDRPFRNPSRSLYGLSNDLSPHHQMVLTRKPRAPRSKLAAIRAMTLVFCIARMCCMTALVAYMSAVYVCDHGVELKACYAIRASHRGFHGRCLL